MMTRASVRYTAERYLWFSTAKAREELGYLPRPLHEAVASAVAWFRGR